MTSVLPTSRISCAHSPPPPAGVAAVESFRQGVAGGAQRFSKNGLALPLARLTPGPRVIDALSKLGDYSCMDHNRITRRKSRTPTCASYNRGPCRRSVMCCARADDKRRGLWAEGRGPALWLHLHKGNANTSAHCRLPPRPTMPRSKSFHGRRPEGWRPRQLARRVIAKDYKPDLFCGVH